MLPQACRDVQPESGACMPILKSGSACWCRNRPVTDAHSRKRAAEASFSEFRRESSGEPTVQIRNADNPILYECFCLPRIAIWPQVLDPTAASNRCQNPDLLLLSQRGKFQQTQHPNWCPCPSSLSPCSFYPAAPMGPDLPAHQTGNSER